MKTIIRTAALAAALAAAGGAVAQEKINLAIGTGGTGGVYYPSAAGSRRCSRSTCPACRRPQR